MQKNPLTAAKDAHKSMSDDGALQFLVIDEKTKEQFSVDLNEDDEDAVVPMNEKPLTFVKKLDMLFKEMQNAIAAKIKSVGVESQHNDSWKCIKIKDEDLQFNIGPRYLTEVTENHLIDNSGYLYSYQVLSYDQLTELADYIISL
jgi:hypothetical protein